MSNMLRERWSLTFLPASEAAEETCPPETLDDAQGVAIALNVQARWRCRVVCMYQKMGICSALKPREIPHPLEEKKNSI